MLKLQTREPTADWIKGVAITLMVYGHITHVGTMADAQRRIVELIYTFHMPLFLVVSGFFFSTGANFFDSLKRLGRRIALPYIIFITLYLLGLFLVRALAIPTNNAPAQSAVDFLRIVFLEPRGGYWFLHAIIVLQLCYLLPTAYPASTAVRNALQMISAVALLLVVTQLGLIAARTAVYFLLGTLIRKYSEVLPSQLALGFLLGLICIALGLNGIYSFTLNQVVWCLAILLFLGGVGQLFERSRAFALFAWIGRNSLVILLLHAIFIVAMKGLANLMLRLDATGVVYSFASTSIVLASSMAGAYVCDRFGLSNYLFGTVNIYAQYADTYREGRRSSIAAH